MCALLPVGCQIRKVIRDPYCSGSRLPVEEGRTVLLSTFHQKISVRSRCPDLLERLSQHPRNVNHVRGPELHIVGITERVVICIPDVNGYDRLSDTQGLGSGRGVHRHNDPRIEQKIIEVTDIHDLHVWKWPTLK